MVVVETVCDFSLALSNVGGPNMWVSETDHSDCICCHDMREIVNSIFYSLKSGHMVEPPFCSPQTGLSGLVFLQIFLLTDEETLSQMSQEREYAVLRNKNEQ